MCVVVVSGAVSCVRDGLVLARCGPVTGIHGLPGEVTVRIAETAGDEVETVVVLGTVEFVLPVLGTFLTESRAAKSACAW